MVANLNDNGKQINKTKIELQNITKYVVVSIAFRYEGELDSTRRSNKRKGTLLGVFTGWTAFTSYIVYAVGFIFGSLLISNGNNNELNIGDLIVVSTSYDTSCSKNACVNLGCLDVCWMYARIQHYQSFSTVNFRSSRCGGTSIPTY